MSSENNVTIKAGDVAAPFPFPVLHTGVYITPGTIYVTDINNTHKQIKELVEGFDKIKKRVNKCTSLIMENWVGAGETAFESETKVLVDKIEDIGDMLLDFYNHLVKSEAAYSQIDDDIRKEYVKAEAQAEAERKKPKQSESDHSSGSGGGY